MNRFAVTWVATVVAAVTALVMAVTALAGGGAAAATGRQPTTLDGVRIGYLPCGLGAGSDFDYEFDDVAFVSRDWESRTADGGYRVDLSVDVLRGAHLSDAAEMHDWVIAYEQRPPAEVHYAPTTVRGRPGWVTGDEVFWLVRPGVAVIVRLDTARWSHRELLRVATSVHEFRTR